MEQELWPLGFIGYKGPAPNLKICSGVIAIAK